MTHFSSLVKLLDRPSLSVWVFKVLIAPLCLCCLMSFISSEMIFFPPVAIMSNDHLSQWQKNDITFFVCLVKVLIAPVCLCDFWYFFISEMNFCFSWQKLHVLNSLTSTEYSSPQHDLI